AVVHVIDTHPMYVDFAPPASIDVQAWIGQATSRLHQMVPDRVRSTCSVTELIRQGTPSREILTLTQELDADLIVTGVHGRRAADVLFFGSTTTHVIPE